MQPKRLNNRVLFLDIIRGIAVINMAAYHLLYDLVYIFGVPLGWFSIRKSFVWEQLICFTFILVAGISFHLSRKPWQNGLRLCGCALILTVVTALVIPEEQIWFGVLHFLGLAVLLAGAMRPLLDRIPSAAGFIISLFLFILVRNIAQGRLGVAGFIEWPLPEWPYQTSYLFWLGLPSKQFASADYFPVLPWFFLFLCGYFGGGRWRSIRTGRQERTGVIEQNGTERAGLAGQKWYVLLDQSFGAVGRKSLWIYMLHQPVIYVVLLILQNLDGF